MVRTLRQGKPKWIQQTTSLPSLRLPLSLPLVPFVHSSFPLPLHHHQERPSAKEHTPTKRQRNGETPTPTHGGLPSLPLVFVVVFCGRGKGLGTGKGSQGKTQVKEGSDGPVPSPRPPPPRYKDQELPMMKSEGTWRNQKEEGRAVRLEGGGVVVPLLPLVFVTRTFQHHHLTARPSLRSFLLSLYPRQGTKGPKGVEWRRRGEGKDKERVTKDHSLPSFMVFGPGVYGRREWRYGRLGTFPRLPRVRPSGPKTTRLSLPPLLRRLGA